ncbi:multiple epidermal growth factor-like domains protein 10 isoform X2 [Ostrea edulis]|uniref:multiple epidermal growth factor-like domains protein 10 isoform X2 n=1 Tax=Ostrea edulis TaxID=37623 RepID=UPI0024AFDD77|nr:multiple epidermal growth factor-like domains protein 10 isoform X2 [Ostrea edulis]
MGRNCGWTEILQMKNKCCSGYTWDSARQICTKCRVGYFGLYCNESCPFPYYGENCRSRCHCEKHLCSFSSGCNVSESTFMYDAVTIFPSSSSRFNDQPNHNLSSSNQNLKSENITVLSSTEKKITLPLHIFILITSLSSLAVIILIISIIALNIFIYKRAVRRNFSFSNVNAQTPLRRESNDNVDNIFSGSGKISISRCKDSNAFFLKIHTTEEEGQGGHRYLETNEVTREQGLKLYESIEDHVELPLCTLNPQERKGLFYTTSSPVSESNSECSTHVKVPSGNDTSTERQEQTMSGENVYLTCV